MSLRRTLAVFALDARHDARRPLTIVLVALLGLLAFSLAAGNVQISSGDATVGGEKAWITSEFAVTRLLALVGGLVFPFFLAVAAGMAIIRDDECRVGEILHSTPLRPSEYVWGKLLAVLVVFGSVLALYLALTAGFNHLWPNAEAEELRGPFLLATYLRPALHVTLPLVVFVAGIAFAVGERTRKPILVFVMPVALLLACAFFLWSWSPGWLDPRVNRALMLIDPTGVRWLSETWLDVDRGVQFYNHESVAYDAPFVLSRLGFLLAGLVAVASSVRHLRRTVRGAAVVAGGSRARVAHEAAAPAPVARHEAPLAPVASRPPGILRGAVDVARAELRELLLQPGLYIFVPLILLQTIGTSLLAVDALGAPLLLTPGTLAVSAMNTLTLLLCLLMTFYTVESLERDRATGLAPIAHATPLPTASLLFGKALANSFVGVVVMGATLLACAIALLAQGKVPLDLGPFAITWGLLVVPTFLVWTSFVAALHALVGNRYTTYGLALAALIYTGYKQSQGEMNWVGNWDLWGTVTWSDMGPFELDRLALVLNRVMVLGVAVLFTALTVRILARRERDPSRTVVRLQPPRLLRASLALIPFLVLPLAAGGWLLREVRAGHEGEAAEKRRKDYWRQNLATWKDAPLPGLAHVDLDLELDPERRWFSLSGTYELVNHGETTLARIPVTVGQHCEDVQFTLDGLAAEPEDRSFLFVLTPKTPLAPGDHLNVGFRWHGTFPEGVSKNGGGASEFILPSGVVLTSFSPSFAPVLGFVEGLGVDEDNRYESKVYAKDFHVGRTEPLLGYGSPFTTRIRVTGPAEYTFNSVGVLEAQEEQDGKRTLTWVSDHPVNFFNVVGARWSVREGDGTRLFYHPAHDTNVAEMGEAQDAARRYYSEWFRAYPWKELKISEFPALATYAQGFPTNITFSEGIGFLVKSDPRAHLAFMVTAHESAHQWWGNILCPGKGPGGNILSEGMAHYSTILLMEQVKGEGPRIELCKRFEERYASNRRVDAERPLVETDGSKDGDTTVTYEKGGWTAWMLHQLMGREVMLAGLQDFIRRHELGPDYPVLQDFTAVLREHAPDVPAYDAFVQQWFHEVVVPEYRLSEATKVADGGGFVVTVKAENVGSGVMPVEIAATTGDRFDEEGRPKADYRDARASVVLAAGQSQVVTLRCDFEPTQVLPDPDAKVLQLRRKDALVRL